MVVIDKPDAPAVASLSAPNENTPVGIREAQADAVVSAFLGEFSGARRAMQAVKAATCHSRRRMMYAPKAATSAVQRVFHRGAMYLVRENHSSIEDLQATIAHELIGHYGTRQMFGPDFVRKANMLFIRSLAESTGCARLRSVAGSLICSTSMRATWFQRARKTRPASPTTS